MMVVVRDQGPSVADTATREVASLGIDASNMRPLMRSGLAAGRIVDSNDLPGSALGLGG